MDRSPQHPCAWPDAALLAACREEAYRSSGPGGQHANKTASGLRLTWLEQPAICAQADEERDRVVNRRRALRRLRLQLACRLRGGSDPAWLEPHRQGAGFALSSEARDLAQVACVLLDALAGAGGELAGAAAACRLSTSRFVRCLAVDKVLWQAAQTLRQQSGLSALRHP
jgi:hypothetical protein